jgi:uncharacterized protein DUF4419
VISCRLRPDLALSFAVDDVVPAQERLPEGDGPLTERLGKQAIAFADGILPLVSAGDEHPLLDAVSLAYRTHRPLVLSPDVVWITLAQGFAMHVRHNSEALRDRFVRHSGKKKIKLEVERWDTAAWPGIVDRFVGGLEQEMGAEMTRLIECDFSTTGPLERMASRVVMLDAFEPYFDYEINCICGIPRVTLLGTATDWERIRGRLDVLATYDLGWWIEPLLPVADAWVETARGRPDPDFWQCIYMPKEIYGGELACGWIGRLFPYTAKGERIPFKAWLPSDMEKWSRSDLESLSPDFERWPRRARPSDGSLEPPREQVRPIVAKRAAWLRAPLGYALPRGLSKVPVHADGVGGPRRYTVVAGLLGVAQEPGGLGLFPRVGWALLEEPVPAPTLLDKLRRRFAPAPA